MVAAFAAVGVTRIPPEVMVLVPEIVTVEGISVLKRRLLVTAHVWVEVAVTVVLFAAAHVSFVKPPAARPVTFPATAPVPALTAHVAPAPWVAQPPRIEVAAFAVS